MLTAEEWIARINAVTIPEIQEVAKRLELQAIFFWKEKRKMIKKDYAQIKETLYTETLENGLRFTYYRKMISKNVWLVYDRLWFH